MITKDSLSLGENIASGLGDVVVQTTPILEALNNESFGVFPYTENWRTEVLEVTGEITAHTPMMELSTTRMAEIIRDAFEMIKTYGTPLANLIADGMSVLYIPGNVSAVANNRLDLSFINTDHPFFKNAIYPTAPRNTALTFESIGFASLGRLKFQNADNAELQEYLKTDHPEMQRIVQSKESSLWDAFTILTDVQCLSKEFVNKNGIFDFTKVKSIDIDKLMKMYAIAAKMFVQDAPSPWLATGSLEDYREFVDMIYSGLTVYLINLRTQINLYRERKVAIVEETPVVLNEDKPSETLGITIKVLEGSATVFFSEEILEAARANNVSIRDAVVAYLYGNNAGKRISLYDTIVQPGVAEELLAAYYTSITSRLNNSSEKFFGDTVVEQIGKFVTANPVLLERIEGTEGTSIRTIISRHFSDQIDTLFAMYTRYVTADRDGDQAINDSGVEEYKQKIVDVILRSKLIPDFLRLIGCTTSAQLLDYTYVAVEGEDNIVDMRQRVTVAVIKFLAPMLIK